MGSWSSKADLPLKELIKFDHQSRSLRTSEVIRTRCALCRSATMVLKMRRRNTRPPFTTLAAHDSRPARDWSCRLVKRLRPREPWSSSLRARSFSSGSRRAILTESSSIPKNVMQVVGSTTLPQWIMNPSFRRSKISVFKASAQTSFDFDIIRKSSKYTIVRSNPLRAIMRFTAWVSLWKIPTLRRAPKGKRVSFMKTVLPSMFQDRPVTAWLRLLRPTDLYADRRSTLAK